MKPTAREFAAATALSHALLEFALAVEAGRDERRPTKPEPLRAPAPAGPDAGRERLLLTGLEAAAMLGVSHGTLLNWRVPNGPIPYVKIRSVVRYAVDDLQEAIKQSRVRRKDSSDEDRAMDC
ncbi:MAG: helix-turn-helix domain-containing protein [Phycisphaeraceae bacterium]|nr:helix-turn-helix domain-containing protein [Phycisphaeraceae bacterium]